MSVGTPVMYCEIDVHTRRPFGAYRRRFVVVCACGQISEHCIRCHPLWISFMADSVPEYFARWAQGRLRRRQVCTLFRGGTARGTAHAAACLFRKRQRTRAIAKRVETGPIGHALAEVRLSVDCNWCGPIRGPTSKTPLVHAGETRPSQVGYRNCAVATFARQKNAPVRLTCRRCVPQQPLWQHRHVC